MCLLCVQSLLPCSLVSPLSRRLASLASVVSLSAPLARFSSLLARIPILGTFLSSMLNIVFSVQTCYFYTSAS